MKKKHILIILTILISNSYNLFSQEKKASWKTKLGFGTYFYTGNTEKFDLSSDFQLTRKDTLIESNLFLKGAYGEVEKVQNKQEFTGGLKFDYKPLSVFSPFVLFSFYNNKFKDIELRLSSLLGAKYSFYMTDASDLSISAAIQYDTERFYEATPDKEKIRLSFRPRVLQSLGKNMEFSAVLFYQPNVQEFDDYMLVFNTSLEAKLLEKISLKLTYNYDYESMPILETIKKTDTSFITSLVLNF